MFRRFYCLAASSFAALGVALLSMVQPFIDAADRMIVTAIEAVATPAAYLWARLSLPKVSSFQIIGSLKRVYRDSWLTSGQSLHQRRWIYC